MSYTKIIDLGMHPYADSFIPETDLESSEPVYPLQCGLDSETGHIMLLCETDPDERYNLYPYSYTSSNSKIARKHWEEFAEHTAQKLDFPQLGYETSISPKVIEIGSNDGFLSLLYKKMGCKVMGVDPSKDMAAIAEKEGIPTYCSIFSHERALNLRPQLGGLSDLIVANNVFNHANDPVDFAKGVESLLSDTGTFIFQVPYWYNTITDEKFDQIYHEHPSYFTVKSACNILKLAGLNVYDVEWVDYHGGSIRVYATKEAREQTKAVQEFIDKEEAAKLFSPEYYTEFMKKVKKKRDKFLSKLYKLSSEGHSIVAVGAAAKGNTFLNYYNLDNSIIDYVTDTSPYKIGKHTPLSRIPIQPDEEVFSKYEKVYAVILSWNISDLIKDKLKAINKNIEFLIK
jgi:SAM-dependent methyltransferase